MSQSKKIRIGIFFLIAILSCFIVGCKKSTTVNDIFFNLNEGEQIVLIAGESLDMREYVSIKPSNAENKSYYLKSFNEDVVKIENKSIVAVSAGNVQIKVVSRDNALKEDLLTVVVKESIEKLATPRNFSFSTATQLVKFDKVAYANSYTLKIDGVEYDLGNSNMFSLSELEGDKLNKLINISVKANSPTYTKALEDSDYANYSIYQAGGVENVEIKNGVLTFNKTDNNLNVNVYLGNRLVVEDSSATSFSLKELNESYAGVSTQVHIQTVITDRIENSFAGQVDFFNSIRQSYDVNILDVPVVSVNQTSLSWQNIPQAEGYAIIIDGEEVEYTENNYFDLSTLDDFNTLFTPNAVRTITVDTIINDLSCNVGKTEKTNPIKVGKLNKTTISFDGYDVLWEEVDNAVAYSFGLSGDGIDELSSTSANSISLAGYKACEYRLKVQALGGYDNESGVHYLSSDEVTKTFKKLAIADAKIENYVLKIDNLGDSVCYVEFENSELNTTLSGDVTELDLSTYEFEVGENKITLLRKGSEESIMSETTSLSFVQLDAITNFRIEKGVVKFDNSEINVDATIKLETSKGNEVQYVLENEDANNHELNTVDTQGENYLDAGEYNLKIYVLGNGSSIFSVRVDGEEAPCETLEFDVLSTPTVSVSETQTILLLEEIANVLGYNIYTVGQPVQEEPEDGESEQEPEPVQPVNEIQSLSENEEMVKTLVGLMVLREFRFELDEGNVKYIFQSIGDGSRYLNSRFSDILEVVRLKTPELSYDNITEIFSVTDENDSNTVEKYELAVNDEVVEGYDFESALHLEESSTVTLKVVAKDKVDGIYYLDSAETSIDLTKIGNETVIYLNAFNNIAIEPVDKTGIYELDIEFVFEGGTELFKHKEDGVLSNGTIDLSYSYLHGFYIVEIIQDYEAVFEEMTEGFGVRVKFNYPKENTKYINSEFSTVKDLEFVRIKRESQFEVNENNQLVISPVNHTQQHGLILVVNESEDLTFVFNGTKLVSNKGEMNCVYDEKTKQYIVNLLDSAYEACDAELLSDFTVKIKYTSHLDGQESYLDSDFTTNITINTLPEATISREETNFKIEHPKNDYTYNNYGLLINNEHLLLLTADAVEQGDGCIYVNYEYVFSNIPEEVLQDVNTMAIVVRNLKASKSYYEICKKGNEILIKRTPSVELLTIKDNSIDDNSVLVEFETYETEYEKDYYVAFYNTSGEEIISKRYVDSDAVDGVISFKLDDIEELEGDFYIEAVVRSSCVYDNVEIFDSVKSNKLEFNKVSTVTGLLVSEGILTFDAVENIVGYEIYEKTATKNIKLNTGLLATNSYDLANITAQKDLIVKAISVSGGYTNSALSEVISVCPLPSFTVDVENGEFYVNFPLQVLGLLTLENATVVPEVTNAQGEIVEIDLDAEDSNISIVGFNRLRVSPQVVLAYNTESLQPEKFFFKIKVRYTKIDEPEEPAPEPAPGEGEEEESGEGDEEVVYYLNSPKVEVIAYGLLAPTDLKKTTDENTEVEFISWTPSDKNILNGENVDVGYDFKVEYGTGESKTAYYSYDSGLKYYDSETKTYQSYNKILSDVSVKFPAGYDKDGDGKIDIEFVGGNYSVSVRAMPNTKIDGYNICHSLYSTPLNFAVLFRTEVGVENGIITWNEQAKATKYKVEIYEDGATEALVTDYLTTNQYDLTNSVFKDYTGVLKVVVTAISTKDDVLSGLPSFDAFFYRLPEATAVHIDDGHLIVSANKYFSIAEVEFVDTTTGKVYIEQYTKENAMSAILALGISSWKNFSDHEEINSKYMFALKLDEEILAVLDGRNYTINVTLIGNTHTTLGTITSSKAMNVSALTATKMNANLAEVSYGVMQFTPNVNYATITKGSTITYTSLVDLNYSFNGAISTDFWHNTAIYKIRVSQSDSFVDIYAVDYFSFIYALENGTITADEYTMINRTNGLYAVVKYNVSATEAIYFNVYLENKINIRDYDEISYYQTTQTIANGVSTWSSVVSEKTIRLAEGGSFVINITMLGGDSQIVGEYPLGQLNAGLCKLQTFVRYGSNDLSALNGKVEFSDLAPLQNGKEIDQPVYRVVVTPINTTDDGVYYLYYGAEADAKTVAEKYDSENHLTANYVKVEKDASVSGSLFFDLSQYVTAGTYKVSIMTLAGLGTGKDQDIHYLLNSKVPATSYIFYKLSDVEFRANNGVLEFEQSTIVRDGNIIYCDNYEVTLYDYENKPYVYTLDRTSENVQFDDVNHIVTYTVPSHITLKDVDLPIQAGKDYNIKIRAIGQENFILNGSYAKNGEDDKIFTFSKSEGVSDLRIEEGILKWKVNDLENHTNTIIKISYLDANNEVKLIYVTVNDVNKVVEDEYLYHYYEISDKKYNGEFITSDVEYTISAYTVGNGNVLHSNYSEEISATRLATVDETSIITVDGVLVWGEIEEAVSYEVTIGGKTFVLDTNTLNVTEHNLTAGSYSVNIRAIGADKINASWLTYPVTGFVQLDIVDINSIVVGGDKVSWETVESAQGYQIVFNYTDLEGEAQTVETFVETNEFTMETTGMLGRFTISITPVGVGEGKVFNANSIEFTCSNDAPTQVKNLEFDWDNNRFVIEVDNADFLSSDSLLLVYNFEEYTSQTDKAVARRLSHQIAYQTENYEIIDENTTRYYVPTTVMGVYSNIYVQVVRPNTLASNKTQLDDVDYHLFSYGAGTFADENNEANPYRIYTAEQLLNIAYFPSANYVFTSSVDLTSLDISSLLLERKAVIASEFTGYIDGGNFSILGFNIDEETKQDIISVENFNNFALFGTLNNATIKNLTIGKEDVQLIIEDTFTTTSSNTIKVALLATDVNNSTINNIKVLNSRIELKQNGSLTKRVGTVYVGGLVSETTNSTITNITINMSVNVAVSVTSDVDVYVGGISARATNSNVEDSTLRFDVETISSNLLTYVGGTFAHFVGNTARDYGVRRTNVEFNMTNAQALYVGGVTGFARYMLIDTCETTGTYTKSYISNNTYVGGLVGHAQSAIIQNSGSFMNFNLTVSNTTNKYIGAIVGMITVQSGISAEITNCYSHYYVEGQEETVVSTSQIIVGMFGSATGASVQGNYKKEQ